MRPAARIVRANISLTLDGRYHGPAGPADTDDRAADRGSSA